jgi:hypothetical protein
MRHYLSVSLQLVLVKFLVLLVNVKCFSDNLPNLFLVQCSLFGSALLIPLLVNQEFDLHESILHLQVVELLHPVVVKVS